MSCGRASRYAASSVATMLLMAACAFHPHTDAAAQPDSRPPAGWPASLNDLTVVWSAEPGIDLTAGPAVAVRAYTESYLLASLTGDDKYLYPGFEHAVDPNKTVNDPMGTQQLWPNTGRPPNPWIGTEQQHILSITSSGRDVIVVTCEYVFGTAEPGRHGDYADRYAAPEPDGGIDPMRITMPAPTDPGRRSHPSKVPRGHPLPMSLTDGRSPTIKGAGSLSVAWVRTGPPGMTTTTNALPKRRHIPTSYAAAAPTPVPSSPPCRPFLAGPSTPRFTATPLLYRQRAQGVWGNHFGVVDVSVGRGWTPHKLRYRRCGANRVEAKT